MLILTLKGSPKNPIEVFCMKKIALFPTDDVNMMDKNKILIKRYCTIAYFCDILISLLACIISYFSLHL